jgi:hypothetical protein
VEPQEDLVHAPADHPVWRESYHFGFGDPATGAFGYATFGKRPHKGRSGFLIAYWAPDVGLLVGQDIDTFESHTNEHDVAGLKTACVTPFETWNVSYEGSLVQAPRIGERRFEEARAVPESERVRVPVSFEFVWQALDQPFAYTWNPAFRAQFDGRHEQPGSCEGVLTIGDRQSEMAGWCGIRDHSWGARDWFGPASWRWVSATFSRPPHFSLLYTKMMDGTTVIGGAVFDGEGAVPIVDYSETVDEIPAAGKPEPVGAHFVVRDARDRKFALSTNVSAILPIRFHPPDPPAPVSWNDRCIVTFEAEHGQGVGEMEFMAAVERDSTQGGAA